MHRHRAYLLASILVVFAFAGSVFAGPDTDAKETKDGWSLTEFEEKWFYTKVNIFYEKPGRVHSTNYHRGKVLPAGSLVLISFAQGREIEFQDSKGRRFILLLVRKHSSESMTLRDYFDQQFSPEDPFRSGGPYQAFSEAERWSVKNGTIEKGMSRAAVLAAYGYPLSLETPSLEDDRWTYAVESLRRPMTVYFKDGRVYKVSVKGKVMSE